MARKKKVELFSFLRRQKAVMTMVTATYGAVGTGIFLALLSEIFDRSYYVNWHTEMQGFCTKYKCQMDDVYSLVGFLMIDGFLDAGLAQAGILTGKPIQEAWHKTTGKVPEQDYILIEIEDAPKPLKRYPKEFYDFAFQEYEKGGQKMVYAKEAAHLKKIFSWLEELKCLDLEHIETLVKAQKWAIESSGDKLWATVPFIPTGLSYAMFNRLLALVKKERAKVESKNSQQNEYKKALENALNGEQG